MNWNEWRFKWGMLWLFVLVVVVILTGCSNNVDTLDQMPGDYQQDPQEYKCQIHQILEVPREPECRNLRLT